MKSRFKSIEDNITAIQSNNTTTKNSLKELEGVIFKFLANYHEKENEFDKFKSHCTNTIDALLKHVQDLQLAMQSLNSGTTLQGYTQGFGAGNNVNAPNLTPNVQTVNTISGVSSVPPLSLNTHNSRLPTLQRIPIYTTALHVQQPLSQTPYSTGFGFPLTTSFGGSYSMTSRSRSRQRTEYSSAEE